jgi:hypothetical protein
MIVISVLTRRLREGKSYEDFREAGLPEQGFGFPTRVVSARTRRRGRLHRGLADGVTRRRRALRPRAANRRRPRARSR